MVVLISKKTFKTCFGQPCGESIPALAHQNLKNLYRDPDGAQTSPNGLNHTLLSQGCFLEAVPLQNGGRGLHSKHGGGECRGLGGGAKESANAGVQLAGQLAVMSSQ